MNEDYSEIKPYSKTYQFTVNDVADLTGTSGNRRRVIRPDLLTVTVYDNGRMSVIAEGRQILLGDGSLGGRRLVGLGYGAWTVKPPYWAEQIVASLGLTWERES